MWSLTSRNFSLSFPIWCSVWMIWTPWLGVVKSHLSAWGKKQRNLSYQTNHICHHEIKTKQKQRNTSYQTNYVFQHEVKAEKCVISKNVKNITGSKKNTTQNLWGYKSFGVHIKYPLRQPWIVQGLDSRKKNNIYLSFSQMIWHIVVKLVIEK